MNILQWISSTHPVCQAELWFCSYARRMDHSTSVSTSVVWIRSRRRTATPYPTSLTSSTACERQDSIQKLTSITCTTWSISERATNGKPLSAPAMAPSNGASCPLVLWTRPPLSAFYEWHLRRPAQCMHAGIPRRHPHLFWLWRRAYIVVII